MIVRKPIGILLMCLCAIVVPSGAAARSGGAEVHVQAGLNTATITFVTNPASAALLEFGVNKTYGGAWVEGKKTTHSILLKSLKPDATYYYRVWVPSGNGHRVMASGSFLTAPIAAATMSVSGTKILLNKVPFIPVMVYGYTCATHDYVTTAASTGADILEAANAGIEPVCDSETIHQALQSRMWWWSNDASDQGMLQGLPELLQGTFKLERTFSPGTVLGLYSKLKSETAGKPVLQWLFNGTMLDPAHANSTTPQLLRALFWTTFVAHGDGVSYYAHVKTFDGMVLKPDLKHESALDVSQLSALEPALANGANVPVATGQYSPVKAAGWRYGGVTYVIAVNTASSPKTVTFDVGTVGSSKGVSLWENSSVSPRNGKFGDELPPQGVRIYRFLPGTWAE